MKSKLLIPGLVGGSVGAYLIYTLTKNKTVDLTNMEPTEAHYINEDMDRYWLIYHDVLIKSGGKFSIRWEGGASQPYKWGSNIYEPTEGNADAVVVNDETVNTNTRMLTFRAIGSGKCRAVFAYIPRNETIITENNSIMIRDYHLIIG